MATTSSGQGYEGSTGMPDESKKARKMFGLATDNNDFIKQFNRYRIKENLDPFSSGIGYIFMTKPACNLSTFNLNKYPEYQYLVTSKLWDDIKCDLDYKTASSGNSSNFIPIVTNLLTGFDTKDVVLTTQDKGENFHAQKIRIGGQTFESEAADSLSLTFQETNTLYLTHLFKTWIDYITNVRTGVFYPNREDVINKEIDYTSSIYYILTEVDGLTVRYWTKYTGVFPSSIPYSTYSWKEGDNSMRQVSINFEYSFKEDLHPDIIERDLAIVSPKSMANGSSSNQSQLEDNWCSGFWINKNGEHYRLYFGETSKTTNTNTNKVKSSTKKKK